MDFFNIFRIKKKPKAPWVKYNTKESNKFKVPEGSVYELLKSNLEEKKNETAYIYYGHHVSYKELVRQIDLTAVAFRSQGIRKGDVVTICMPNTPEGLFCFYALNKIGAIANMIHPLSSEQEIKHYLISTNSVMLVTIDICYEKVLEVIGDTDVYKTIIVSASKSMSIPFKVGYILTKSYKIKKPYFKGEFMYWNDFIRKGLIYNGRVEFETTKDTPAVILHSGGTTGIPKGIILTNANFNALAEQVRIVLKELEPSDVILGIMPIFHGFGLAVSIHTPFYIGCTINLLPQFDAKTFDKLIMKTNPQVIVGVPTLYEALLNTKNKKLDLSDLKYAVSGGDTLTIELTKKVNAFLKEHKATIKVMQGYGMTESTAATSLAYGEYNFEGSIGIPLPGNYFKVVRPKTQETLKPDEIGELCVCGPAVMVGYLNNEKETNEVLQIHSDGNIWLHTGDLGRMTKDGIIYYENRLKRMIVSSGYNVYPQQIESVIEAHEAVLKCTVVGIPHKYKMQVAKAVIVLKNNYTDSWAIRKSIKEHCEKNLVTYSLPYEYEYRKSLPKTLIGKVDLKKLSEEYMEGKENGK